MHTVPHAHDGPFVVAPVLGVGVVLGCAYYGPCWQSHSSVVGGGCVSSNLTAAKVSTGTKCCPLSEMKSSAFPFAVPSAKPASVQSKDGASNSSLGTPPC